MPPHDAHMDLVCCCHRMLRSKVCCRDELFCCISGEAIMESSTSKSIHSLLTEAQLLLTHAFHQTS